MRLHHASWRSAAALGQDSEALRHLQHYLQLERQRSVRQLRAQSDLFVTRMEAEQARMEAQRQHARARALEADVRRDQLTGLGNRLAVLGADAALLVQQRQALALQARQRAAEVALVRALGGGYRAGPDDLPPAPASAALMPTPR